MDIVKLIINTIITLFYLINFILLVKHFLKNLSSMKDNNKIIILYWFDFLFILLIYSIMSFFKNFDYFTYSLIVTIKKKIFLYYPLIYANQSILNIISSFQLLCKISIIQNKQISNLKDNTYSTFGYFFKQIITIIIDGFIIFSLEYKLKNFNFYYIIMFQASLMIISIILFFIVSKKYKNFLFFKKSFDKNNINDEKKYEISRKKILAATEHFLYKNICDFLLNFPSLIMPTNTTFLKNYKNFINDNKDNNIILNITYLDLYYYLNIFFGFLYLYIFGIMLLNIDYFNNGYIERIINFLFCTKKFHFYFGIGKNAKKMKSLYLKNIKMDKNNYNSYFKDEPDNENNNTTFLDESFSNSSNGIISSEESSEEEDNKKSALKYEYSPCNFFIIYKLLYLYFKINKNIFLELEKTGDENNISKIDILNRSKIDGSEYNQTISSMHDSSQSDGDKIFRRRIRYNSLHQKKYKGKASNINVRDYDNNIKEKIDNINKISLSNKTKLETSKKYNLDELAPNIEEQNLKKYFIKHIFKNINQPHNNSINISKSFSTIKEKDESLYSSVSSEVNNFTKRKSTTNTNNIDEATFSIKLLNNDALFDIFPYYNLKINDIIKSLDISSNMELFYKFSEEKLKNESYNYYYTKDTLLNIEIYDEDYFTTKQLKSFITEYKNYLFDKITNFSYTFLPLIIGIFNIKYLAYNKIIVLFRNPLTFSYNMNFHYWLKFIFSGADKKIETSTDKKDFINLYDIESSNNILLEITEYKNSVEILDNDLSFLQNNIKYNMNFKLNLFILNDEYKNNLYEGDQTELSTVYPNINDNNNIKNNDLEEIVRESLSFFPYDDFNYKKFNFHKKYFGSDDISLLEKLYLNELVNNRYIFKIYFTEIFSRRVIEENKEQIQKINIEKNIIHNNSSFSINEENEDEEDEEKKKRNIIADNNSKYCELLKSKLVNKIFKGSINTFGDKDN